MCKDQTGLSRKQADQIITVNWYRSCFLNAEKTEDTYVGFACLKLKPKDVESGSIGTALSVYSKHTRNLQESQYGNILKSLFQMRVPRWATL